MVLTNAAKNITRNWWAGQTATAPTHVACGSDNTAPTVDDTALGSEIGNTRRAFDSTSYGADRLVEFEMVLPSTVPSGLMPIDIVESGLFNASSAGSMFTRDTFAAVEKTEDVELQSIIAVRFE